MQCSNSVIIAAGRLSVWPEIEAGVDAERIERRCWPLVTLAAGGLTVKRFETPFPHYVILNLIPDIF